MRFVVISYGIEQVDLAEVGDAPIRSYRYRDQLMADGKLIEHAHLAGQGGHAWIFEAGSADELDRIVADDPMTRFCQSAPVILLLTSDRGMAETERQLSAERKQRFLVIAHRIDALAPHAIEATLTRAARYRERLVREGTISLHGDIAGQQGHVWVYHVDGIDQLDEVMSADPMSAFYQNNPTILAFCSYQRMHNRFFSVPAPSALSR